MRIQIVNLLRIVLLSMLCLPVVIFADESEEPWRVYLHSSQQMNTILAVTSEGIVDSWEIPDRVQGIELSPNGQFAAITFNSDEIVLYDLENRSCCEPLVTAELLREPDSGTIVNFSIGKFNHNGTLFAFNYSSASEGDPYGTHGIAVIDVQSGRLIATRSSDQSPVAGWFGSGVATYPLMNVLPGSTPEAYDESILRTWNPFTDQITSTVYIVATLPYTPTHDIGEMLVTGERIVASFWEQEHLGTYMLDYPYVAYAVNGTTYPIWFDPNQVSETIINPPRDAIARWISDGKYVYNRILTYYEQPYTDEVVEILSRSGEVETLDIPITDRFLAGTPQGWLAVRYEGDAAQLVHHQYDDGHYEAEKIAMLPIPDVDLLKAPLLGHSLGTDFTPFPEAALITGQG